MVASSIPLPLPTIRAREQPILPSLVNYLPHLTQTHPVYHDSINRQWLHITIRHNNGHAREQSILRHNASKSLYYVCDAGGPTIRSRLELLHPLRSEAPAARSPWLLRHSLCGFFCDKFWKEGLLRHPFPTFIESVRTQPYEHDSE